MPDLETLVSENRFTISVIFPLVGALLFVTSAENLAPEVLSFNPLFILFGTFVMRTPLIAGLKPLVDRKMLLGVSFLVFYSYFIEFVGIQTGWPYGSFEYLVSLGPIVSGVPIGLPLFFIPLVLNSYIIVDLLEVGKGYRKIVPTTLLVILIDLILDPAAVSLGLWAYESGIYYGVPLSNYMGWILSGFIASAVVHVSFSSEKFAERIRSADFILDDLVSFVLLWGLVNLYYGNLVPVILTAVLVLFMRKTESVKLALSP